MASTINAITTGVGGIVSTADNSGNLNIQSAGTTIVAVTSTGAAVTGLLSGSTNYTGFKNRIINGAMVIDQRNAGASVTPISGQYTLDRWDSYLSQTSKFSVQQNAGAVTPPVGYTKYLGVTSLSAYSVISTDYFTITQLIEGFNTSDLAWGTASASTVTLSFWVRSSLTGTFGGSISNGGENYTYPYAYSIPIANTWTQIFVTIAGPTSGTWATNNTIGIELNFNLGCGTGRSGTAGVWASTWYGSPTGATSVVGTSGATFYITGVQLEAGSAATSFDVRSYGTELALCQRYYYRKSSISTSDYITTFQVYSANGAFGKFFDFPVTMRASPTGNISSYAHIGAWSASGAGSTAFSAGSLVASSTSMNTGGFTGSSGLVAGNSTVIEFKSASGWIDASAEL